MRPGQNKRMRGRNNNNNSNRKGPNPLTRSYESNGPDVKIRGTAHHIGEKYLQLARDAQSSGDPVMAESYLQHAEHYFRLIASAQQAQQQAAYGYQQRPGEQVESDDGDDDDDFVSLPDRFASPSERVAQVPPPQPQQPPYPDRQPYTNGGGERPYEQRQERAFDRPNNSQQPNLQDRQTSGERSDRPYDNRNNRGDRNGYQDRSYQDRNNQDRNSQDRSNPDRSNPERNNQERGNFEPRANQERSQRDFDNRGFRNNRGPRDFRDGAQGGGQSGGQPREAREPRPPVANDSVPTGLPAFITAPTRPIPEAEPQPNLADAGTPADATEEEFHLRPRRRRRPKPEFAGSDGENQIDTPAGDPAGE